MIYNAATQVVALVEADSPEEAQRILDAHVERTAKLSLHVDGSVSPPFESELQDGRADLPVRPVDIRWR